MQWIHDASYFFGGAFLTNAVPHFVSGVMGRPFQSPFAQPRGEGLSSSTVNVLWGFFNLVVGYVLTCRVGDFDLPRWHMVLPRLVRREQGRGRPDQSQPRRVERLGRDVRRCGEPRLREGGAAARRAEARAVARRRGCGRDAGAGRLRAVQRDEQTQRAERKERVHTPKRRPRESVVEASAEQVEVALTRRRVPRLPHESTPLAG